MDYWDKFSKIKCFQNESKEDIIITDKVTELWNVGKEANVSLKYILWRYLLTENGVFRIYPGTSFGRLVDPTRMLWWVVKFFSVCLTC